MHKAFTVHMLNDDGKKKASAIAEAFDFLLEELQHLIPVGRELAIVITKLEEAAFFAKKGMASDPANATEGVSSPAPRPPTLTSGQSVAMQVPFGSTSSLAPDGEHLLVSPPAAPAGAPADPTPTGPAIHPDFLPKE